MNRNIEYCSILREARKRIATAQRGFLCVAVSDAGVRLDMPGSAWELRELIGERMQLRDADGYTRPISSWLVEVAGIPEAALTKENLLIYRLLWIDSMIKEFTE